MLNDNFSHYLAQIKERRPEIAEFLLSCERNHLALEDFTAMRHSMRRLIELTRDRNAQLHKLALSMQDAITPEAIAAPINLVSLSRTLLSACHDKLLTTGSAKPSAFAPTQPIMIAGRMPLILSVDDDRIIHHMIEGMFGGHATIITANNGIEGLAMIRHHRPDLVLLDDAMPQMTGMKLIESIAADHNLRDIPVIMLTSSDRPQDIERANAAGAADYVIKPFNPVALANAVYKVLGKLAG